MSAGSILPSRSIAITRGLTSPATNSATADLNACSSSESVVSGGWFCRVSCVIGVDQVEADRFFAGLERRLLEFRTWLAEEVPLQQVGAEVQQRVPLGRALDALGDDLHPEVG